MDNFDSSFLRLPNFEIRQIRALLCIAEELHFGKAAERLFTSQPALSRTIRSLEDAVGVSLLARSTRRVRLTAAGAAFVAEANLAFSHLGSAAAAAKDAAAGKAGRLRIGYMDFAINGRMPTLLNKFRALYPGDTLNLEYNPSSNQRTALLEGRLDVGLLIGEFVSRNISNVLVEQYDYVALIPESHRLARADKLYLSDLAREPFVLGSEEAFGTFRQLLLPLCHGIGFFPKIVQEVSSSNGIFGMVAAGVGVSIYAGCARNIQRVGVVVKPLVDVQATIPTFAAWVTDNPSQVLLRFKEHLIRHAQLGIRI